MHKDELPPMKPVRRVLVLSARPHYLDADLLLGVAHYASDFGRWKLRSPTGNSSWPRRVEPHWDGLIVRQHPDGPAEGHSVDKLEFDGPTVIVGTEDLADGHPTVYWDTDSIGKAAAEYFLEAGFGRFVAIGRARHETARSRMEAFAARVGEDGHACQFVEPSGSEDPAAWDRVLQALPNAVAVFTTSDHDGRQLLDACERAGRSVPEQLAVIGGSDERLVCELNQPRLSSVELPAHRVGFEAAALLARLLNGEPAPDEPLLLPSGGVVERDTSHRTATEDTAVDAALRYMRAHCTEPITLEHVLRQVPLSRRALEIRFKKTMGHTLQKELWRLRVARAKVLLMRTTLPMPEVAEQAGFTDAQRMYEVFRRETGDSPSAYRQRRT
ncbi:MAG: substrate-binding domain-containing protein [Planctomycetota bacterium]